MLLLAKIQTIRNKIPLTAVFYIRHVDLNTPAKIMIFKHVISWIMQRFMNEMFGQSLFGDIAFMIKNYL